MAETTFYARRTHPAQHLLPTKKDEQPIKTKNKWTRAEFKRKDRKVRSSSKKEPISKDEVQSAKKYLKVHDLALVGDNQQISFKQYLADQNETEGEKLAKEFLLQEADLTQPGFKRGGMRGLTRRQLRTVNIAKRAMDRRTFPRETEAVDTVQGIRRGVKKSGLNHPQTSSDYVNTPIRFEPDDEPGGMHSIVKGGVITQTTPKITASGQVIWAGKNPATQNTPAGKQIRLRSMILGKATGGHKRWLPGSPQHKEAILKRKGLTQAQMN